MSISFDDLKKYKKETNCCGLHLTIKKTKNSFWKMTPVKEMDMFTYNIYIQNLINFVRILNVNNDSNITYATKKKTTTTLIFMLKRLRAGSHEFRLLLFQFG